ncbi:MAG TPA: (d)CMP kinase [Bacillota bacterium]|nr:(d)CMP kinase [Bacillota bacterium]
MQGIIRIAIDGPAGAGKSTIAKALASKLGIDYIDTGAMYRALAVKILCAGVDLGDAEGMDALLQGTDVSYDRGRVFLDGSDVSSIIRLAAVTKMSSDCSALPAVREKLVALQQAMARRKSMVMDGRDICSKVLPDAEFKFFLTASSDVRAARRVKELEEKGEHPDFESIKAAIELRDYQDTHREHSPLVKTEDAIEVDSSNLGIDSVVELFMSHINKRKEDV